MPDYQKVCFVIMPFGIKRVGDRDVNFDAIFDGIFVPAISAVGLPEGGKLEPHRTDRDFFSGDIGNEMFQYLEYSRFAVADITGLNPNVFYELGARHRVREAGTAIFRQAAAPIPFDIKSIKAFPYEYEPAEQAEHSRELITRVLSESLRENRLDSPIRIALRAQQSTENIDERLRAAENAIRSQDWDRAMGIYRDAIAVAPNNPLLRMKLGVLLKDRGRWVEALAQFDGAINVSSGYAEAWREKGIAEGKLEPSSPSRITAAETALRRAIELNAEDFDAMASLGGVLKRAGRLREARDEYRKAAELSNYHPYPLLNEFHLRVQLTGQLEFDGHDNRALDRAERMRSLQAQQNPPYDAPWCLFDLAEIKLYRKCPDEFLRFVRDGLKWVEAKDNWQATTFLDSLRSLQPASADLPGLAEGVRLIEDWLRP